MQSSVTEFDVENFADEVDPHSFSSIGQQDPMLSEYRMSDSLSIIHPNRQKLIK
jgi:hypothetical protein